VTAPSPDITTDSFPHLGPAYLKSHLESLGYCIQTVNFTSRVRSHIPWLNPYRKALAQIVSREPLKRYLLGERVESVDSAAGVLWTLLGKRPEAKVYGFSVLSQYSLHATLAMAAWLKRRQPRQRLIIGGCLFSDPRYRDLLALPWLDHVVSGPGMHVLPLLLDRSDAPRWISSVDEPLASNPLPSFEREDLQAFRKSGVRSKLILPYQVTRGCRYQCRYCTEANTLPQHLPIDRVVTDLGILQTTYKPDAFFLTGVNLNNDPLFLQGLCDTLSSRKPALRFGCPVSARGLDANLIKSLAAAGCKFVLIGIETGSPRIRTLCRIKKTPSLLVMERTLRYLRQENINAHLYFMHGFPGELDSDFEQTLTAAFRLGWHAANGTVHAFGLMTGAPAFKEAAELGIKPRHNDNSADPLSCLDPLDPTRPDYLISIPFDEIEGMSWEERVAKNKNNQDRLAAVFHYYTYPHQLWRMAAYGPLYQLKKMLLRPYYNLEFLL